MSNPYQQLEQRFSEIANLKAIIQLLNWDARTMMPAGGLASRADQLGTLERQKYRLFTEPQLSNFLTEAEQMADQLNEWQKANLKLMRHDHTHATAVDETLAAAAGKAFAEAGPVWLNAKKNDDFASFAPVFIELVSLQREIAQAKAEVLNCKPIDALLDFCEPGLRSDKIDPIFSDLLRFLPDFYKRVQEKLRAEDEPLPLQDSIPQATLEPFIRVLSEQIGYSFEGARIDPAGHSFALVEVPGDARINVFYRRNNPLVTMKSMAHEIGHALYEQNLPHKWRHQPVGRARGFATHESQSLALDMMAFRSEEFLGFLGPFIRERLQKTGPAWSTANLIKLLHQVRPSMIRIDADEVTYPLHVMLRYRLEKALINGDLAVGDLPQAWNDGMEKLLGIRPANDREGCLQDIHWAVGLWGYFPSYVIGALKAAQFFTTACQQTSTMMTSLSQGDMSPFVSWLTENVHSKASLLSSEELMMETTGEALNTRFFKCYLQNRYLSSSS